MLFLKIFLYYISYYIYPDPRPRPKVPKRHTKWQKKFGAAGMFYSFFFKMLGLPIHYFLLLFPPKFGAPISKKQKKAKQKKNVWKQWAWAKKKNMWAGLWHKKSCINNRQDAKAKKVYENDGPGLGKMFEKTKKLVVEKMM